MKVLLIATPRSGSMSVYKKLRTRYSPEKNYFEIFNPRTHKWPNEDYNSFISQQYNSWLETPNSLAKIDPRQVYTRTSRQDAKKILNKMLSESDKIFYLYRRNTSEQVTSLALAKKTKEWNSFRTILEDITEHEFTWCGENILYRYIECLDLHEKHPGEILCMEDILNYEPYQNKPQTKYEYTGQNIEDLFSNNLDK